MGTSKRTEYRGAEAPGPGGYSPKYQQEGPAYSMKGKTLSKERLDVPGPGQYEMRSSAEGPQWVMGSSKRTEYRGTEAPGPGQYDQEAGKDGPAYAFGGAQRE